MMATKEVENRVFVGGLALDVTERELEDAFRRFGKIVDCQHDARVDNVGKRYRTASWIWVFDLCQSPGMEDAIREMNGREFGGRIISVNKAQPKAADDARDDYGGGYSSGARGGYQGGDRSERLDECFKCGRLGHWARNCPSAGGGRGPFSSRSRYLDAGGRGDRFGVRDRYAEDRYDGGRYGERDRLDSRDKYESRDHFLTDRYPVSGDRYAGDRYRGSDRYPQNGYDKDRGYDRRGGDRYGSGGAVRNVGVGYADRPGPYDRPSRSGGVGRPSSFDRY